PQLDILHCLVNIPNEVLPLKESVTTDELQQQYRLVKPKSTTTIVATEQQCLSEPTMMINSSYLPSQDTLNIYPNS
ncbi:unnamed protein product, partial [Rotaria magnacalcarata]